MVLLEHLCLLVVLDHLDLLRVLDLLVALEPLSLLLHLGLLDNLDILNHLVFLVDLEHLECWDLDFLVALLPLGLLELYWYYLEVLALLVDLVHPPYLVLLVDH